MTDDERFMSRALELAAEVGFTSPNPKVGAVVVRDSQIVAEGAHQGAGTPHAEAVALRDIDARGASLYVTLEPCVHEGRMPPCAPAVIEAGVSRVVVALEDPDERVAGRGIALLRSSGIAVDVGICELQARGSNRAYLHQRRTKRPLVSLKLALSLDGKLAAADGSSKWITGEVTRRRVHQRRLESDGVLIGSGTVISDDPLLTVRDIVAPRQPVRVLCDATGRVPATSQIFGRAGEVIVMTTIACPHPTPTRWKEAGAEVVVIPQAPGGGVDLAAVMDNLGARRWLEVYCEGGAALATSLLRADLVDRLDLNYGPVLVGGAGVGLGDLGVTTMGEASRWRTAEVMRMGDDTVMTLDRGR